jgi:hypothetical protein
MESNRHLTETVSQTLSGNLRSKPRKRRGDFEAQITKPSTLVLRPKPRNHHSDFEAQITKPSTLVLRTKPRNRRSGFEAKPLTNHRNRF